MARLAHAVVLGAAALGVWALVACNALSGASDLQFDEAPEPDATLADRSVPVDSSSDADTGLDDADGGDGAPITCDASALDAEVVTATPMVGGNLGTGNVSAIPWTVTPGADGAPTAKVVLDGQATSSWYLTTGYGFDTLLPPNAIVQGFEVAVTRSSVEVDTIEDSAVELVQNGAPIGTKKVGPFWPDAAQAYSYGSTTDLWGASWTLADVTSPNFGVAISVLGRTLLNNTSETAKVTSITVKVSFVRCQ